MGFRTSYILKVNWFDLDYQQAIPRSDCNQIPNHLKAKAMKSIVVVGL